MFLDGPRIASLELRGPLLERSTPAWNMSNIDFATLAINGFLRQASEITSLTLLVMPMAFSPNINALTRLEDLTIWQSYISLGPRTLTIDASQAENLQSLSVCTLSPCIIGPIISTSLKHLTMACGTAISYAGNNYDLRRRNEPALPFTQLQTVTVMVSKALSTARWLEALAHQLSAAKNTLRLLWVYSKCGYTTNSRDHISFQAYTALQKIRFSLAAFTPHESGTLYSHKFRIHLAAPTVTEIDLYLESTPISAHTLKNGILKFVWDNRSSSRVPLLRRIKLSAQQDVMEVWRKKSISTSPPTPQELATSQYERFVCSDGRVEWMPLVGYLSTVRALRDILASGWAKMIGTINSIHIVVDDAQKLVTREDALQLAREAMVS